MYHICLSVRPLTGVWWSPLAGSHGRKVALITTRPRAAVPAFLSQSWALSAPGLRHPSPTMDTNRPLSWPLHQSTSELHCSAMKATGPCPSGWSSGHLGSEQHCWGLSKPERVSTPCSPHGCSSAKSRWRLTAWACQTSRKETLVSPPGVRVHVCVTEMLAATAFNSFLC